MTNDVITTLVGSGIDAFANLWDIEFTFPKAITMRQLTNSETSRAYSVRSDNFTPPEPIRNTYQQDYQGIQLTRLGAKITLTREITISFRLDGNYALYNDLMLWKHLNANGSGDGNITFKDEGVATDDGSFGGIVCRAYKSSGKTLQTIGAGGTNLDAGATWQFFKVSCIEVGKPAFQRASDTPPVIQAKFVFIRMVEPINAIT